MIKIDQGSSETLEVRFINQTGDELPDGLTAELTLKTNPVIEKTSSITDLKAVFTFTPTDTNKPLTSYRGVIKISNFSDSYVKFLPIEVLIKDPYADD